MEASAHGPMLRMLSHTCVKTQNIKSSTQANKKKNKLNFFLYCTSKEYVAS